MAAPLLSLASVCLLALPHGADGIESCEQVLIEEALERGDAAFLRPAAAAHPDLFLLAAERVLERRLARGCAERFWLDVACWAAGAAPLCARLEGLAGLLWSPCGASRAALAGELAGRARCARDGGDFCASLLRDRAAAAEYRAVGLAARASQCERAALSALAELNRAAELRDVAERLRGDFEGACFDAARAEVLARLAQAYHALGEVPLAWETMLEALDLARRLPDGATRAFACDEGGWISATLGHLGRALALFAEGEAAAELAGDQDRVARLARSRGNILLQLGDEEGAIAAMRRSLALARRAGLSWRSAQTATRLASLLAALGRWDEARAALALAEGALGVELGGDLALQAERLELLAGLHAACAASPLPDELRGAIEALLPRVGPREQYALALELFDDRRRRQGLQGSLAAAREVVRLAERLGHAGPISRGLIDLARCQSALGEHAAALASVEDALRRRDDLRRGLLDVRVPERLEFTRQAGTLASQALAVAAAAWRASGDPRLAERALAILDCGRARSLLEAAHAGLVPGAEGIGLERGAFAAIRERVLAPHVAILAYDLSARVGIAASAEAIRLFDLPPAERVEASLDFMRHALFEVQDPDAFRRQAELLSGQLLGPIADLLEGKERLVCLADGPLNDFPLDLLLLGESGAEPGFAGLPWLFRRHTVAHVPCLGSLLPARAPRPAARPPSRLLALAYAGPLDQPALPAVETEVRAIAALFQPPARATVRTAAAASESLLRELHGGEYDVLHLAAHAWADRLRGADSGVQLAPGGGHDGRLTVAEMAELRLPLDLVVVSGCEGGAGQAAGAEGVISVGWGFLCAGARAVLVSTGRVEDRLLPRLFVPFYAELLAGRDAASALRRARLELLAAEARAGGAPAALLPFLVIEGVR